VGTRTDGADLEEVASAAANVRRYGFGVVRKAAEKCCRSTVEDRRPTSVATRSTDQSANSRSRYACLMRVRAIQAAGVMPACSRNRRQNLRTLIAARRTRLRRERSATRLCSTHSRSAPIEVPSALGTSYAMNWACPPARWRGMTNGARRVCRDLRAEVPAHHVEAEVEPRRGTSRRQHLPVVDVEHVRIDLHAWVTAAPRRHESNTPSSRHCCSVTLQRRTPRPARSASTAASLLVDTEHMRATTGASRGSWEGRGPAGRERVHRRREEEDDLRRADG